MPKPQRRATGSENRKRYSMPISNGYKTVAAMIAKLYEVDEGDVYEQAAKDWVDAEAAKFGLTHLLPKAEEPQEG
ncbi:MAG TPA: hypothetical protein VGN26_04020 [Armatimonadota bacterium]